jgi:hypothetical protein
VTPIQTEKYYNSTVLAVIKATLAQHQLDTPQGSMYGYVLARKMTAEVLRRMLGTSNRTPPVLLILEAGWDLPDRAIITEKMTFHVRMAERKYKEEGKQRRRGKADKTRKDAPTHVWTTRLQLAEMAELWREMVEENEEL